MKSVFSNSLMLAAAALLMAGCSPSNFTSSASSASKVDAQGGAAAGEDGTGQVPQPEQENEEHEGCDRNGPGPLDNIDVKNVVEIDLNGMLVVGSVKSIGNSVTKIDSAARTLRTELMLDGSGRGVASAGMSCVIEGSGLDVDRLERNLKSIRFQTRAIPSMFGKLTTQSSIRIVMKDGTEMKFVSGSNNSSSGLKMVVARDLQAQMQEVNLNRAKCSSL